MKVLMRCLSLGVVFLSGCAALTTPPAVTPEEFKAQVVSPELSSYLFKDSYVTQASYSSAAKAASDKWLDCYNFNRHNSWTRSEGGMTTGHLQDTDAFHAKATVVSPSKTQLSLQYKSSLKMLTLTNTELHEDGVFTAVADIQKSDNGRADIEYYSTNGEKDLWPILKDWAEGKDAPCPIEFDE